MQDNTYYTDDSKTQLSTNEPECPPGTAEERLFFV